MLVEKDKIENKLPRFSIYTHLAENWIETIESDRDPFENRTISLAEDEPIFPRKRRDNKRR